MKHDISDTYIMLIRQCKKKNRPSLKGMKKIIGKGYALDREFVSKQDVIYHLTQIVVNYELINDWHQFIAVRLNPERCPYLYKKYDAPKCYDENLLVQLISVIRIAELKKFPRYISPSKFK